MDTRLTSIQGFRWFVAAVAGMALLMALAAPTASAASGTACRVRDSDTGKIHQTLQAAVDAASKGDRLTVNGSCPGPTVIDKDLTIRGIRNSRTRRPILDGDEKGRVLRVKPAARVTIRDLMVQGGVVESRNTRSGQYIQGRGAGVLNQGTLRLVDVVVRRNAAWQGAGIYNAGVLRLRGRSRVSDNTSYPALIARSLGTAGLYNTGVATLGDASSIRDNVGSGVSNGGTLTLNGRSSVLGNASLGVGNGGTLTLNDQSAIRRNGLDGWAGGGVYAVGIVRMRGRSVIGHNLSVVYGGGVTVASGGSLILDDASAIRGNRATSEGGGVFVWPAGSVTLNDSSVVAANRAWSGGGVHIWLFGRNAGGTLTMTGASRITRNKSKESGGGVAFESERDTVTGVTCGPGGNVFNNSPDDCYFGP